MGKRGGDFKRPRAESNSLLFSIDVMGTSEPRIPRLINRRNLLIHTIAHNYNNVNVIKLLIARLAAILEYASFHSFTLRKQQPSMMTSFFSEIPSLKKI